MAALLRDLLPGLSPKDLEIATAYISTVLIDRDLTVSPDELLQLMHALPLRASSATAAAGMPGQRDTAAMAGAGGGDQTFQPGFVHCTATASQLLGRRTVGGHTASATVQPLESLNMAMMPFGLPPHLAPASGFLTLTPPSSPPPFGPTATAAAGGVQQQYKQQYNQQQLAGVGQQYNQQRQGDVPVAYGNRMVRSALTTRLPEDSFLPAPPYPAAQLLLGPPAPRLDPAQQQQQPWLPGGGMEGSSGGSVGGSVGAPLLGQRPTAQQQQQMAAASRQQGGGMGGNASAQWMAQNRGYVPPVGGYHQPLAPWAPPQAPPPQDWQQQQVIPSQQYASAGGQHVGSQLLQTPLMYPQQQQGQQVMQQPVQQQQQQQYPLQPVPGGMPYSQMPAQGLQPLGQPMQHQAPYLQLQQQQTLYLQQQQQEQQYPSIPSPRQYSVMQPPPLPAQGGAVNQQYPPIPSRQYTGAVQQQPAGYATAASPPVPPQYGGGGGQQYGGGGVPQPYGAVGGAPLLEDPYLQGKLLLQQYNQQQRPGTAGSTPAPPPLPWRRQTGEHYVNDPPVLPPPPGSRSATGSDWVGGGAPGGAPRAPPWPLPAPEYDYQPVDKSRPGQSRGPALEDERERERYDQEQYKRVQYEREQASLRLPLHGEERQRPTWEEEARPPSSGFGGDRPYNDGGRPGDRLGPEPKQPNGRDKPLSPPWEDERAGRPDHHGRQMQQQLQPDLPDPYRRQDLSDPYRRDDVQPRSYSRPESGRYEQAVQRGPTATSGTPRPQPRGSGSGFDPYADDAPKHKVPSSYAAPLDKQQFGSSRPSVGVGGGGGLGRGPPEPLLLPSKADAGGRPASKGRGEFNPWD